MEIAFFNPILTTPNIGVRRMLLDVKPLDAKKLIEVNCIELAQALRDLGHHVTVFAADAFLTGHEIQLDQHLTVRSLQTRLRGIFFPAVIPFTPGLVESAELRDTDVVHSAEFHQPTTFFACRAVNRYEIPLVVWQETYRHMRYPSDTYQHGHELSAGLYVRKRAARYIPRTTKARGYLRFLGVKASKIGDWVPTGINLATYRPAPAKRRPEDFGLPGDYRMLAIVGRLHEDKGIDVAIRAEALLLRRGHRVGLLIRGSGPELPRLQALSRKLGVENSVRFLKHISRAEMVELYNAVDILLCTSRNDLLPFALLEASACGLPCVASHVGALEDAVRHGTNGLLVNPNSPEEVASAVETLLHNDSLLESMGASGRKRAEELFDLRLVARRLAEAYRESIESQAETPEPRRRQPS